MAATAKPEIFGSNGYSWRFSGESGLAQDEEYCIVKHHGCERKIRLHDYDEIYKIPGLYEAMIYEKLECKSPEVVASLLIREIDQCENIEPSDLVVLDLGAGNGIVGEVLSHYDVEQTVGVDIIEEAKTATERDRPGIYDQYIVGDLCDLPPRQQRALEAVDFNCLVSVAALGFGDIPPVVFINAFNLIADNGWVAFNVKKDFIESSDPTGFAKLIQQLTGEKIMDMKESTDYCHRFAIDGSPLTYNAIVARKRSDIPDEVIAGYAPAMADHLVS